jgi:hypothetical protein
MTYSLIGAGRTTHLKIMLVALIAASASVVGIGVHARPDDQISGNGHERTDVMAVTSDVKCGRPGDLRRIRCHKPARR